MRRILIWLPLLLFAAFIGLFASGLFQPDDRIIQSRLVGQPLPDFDLPAAASDRLGLGSRDMAGGKPRLLNIFASWCVPCAAEAPQLLALKKAGARIDAVAIRDKSDDVAAFLARYGDPYQRIGDDRASRLQLALGSSGVPETFVIDARGKIVAQHVGDIRAEDVAPLLQKLKDAR